MKVKILKDYVETMFRDFPKTKATLDLKANILDSMENKYEDLVTEGKTEQEAIGIVIAQFGNIDELKEEYDILPSNEDVEYLPTEKLMEYISFKEKFSQFIALGVFMIIISLLAPVLLPEAFGIAVFLIVVAISVAIFILFGLRSGEYADIEEGRYHLFGNDKAEIQKKYDAFKPKFQVAITVGVVLCILSVALFYIFSEALHVNDMFSFLVFFGLIATAVFMFIKFGILNVMYEILLRSEKALKDIQDENNLGWVYGVTMPLASMIFLAFGFLKNAWHPAWIIFPITAILTNGIVEILKRRDR